MLEKQIEQYLRKQVKERLNGLALKFVSPGFSGVPDRIVLLPGGRIYFVELKAPGNKPRKLQFKVCEKLRVLGFRVYVLDCYTAIDVFIENVEWLKNGV